MSWEWIAILKFLCQYRAMFVIDCTVLTDQRLKFPVAKKTKKGRGRWENVELYLLSNLQGSRLGSCRRISSSTMWQMQNRGDKRGFIYSSHNDHLFAGGNVWHRGGVPLFQCDCQPYLAFLKNLVIQRVVFSEFIDNSQQQCCQLKKRMWMFQESPEFEGNIFVWWLNHGGARTMVSSWPCWQANTSGVPRKPGMKCHGLLKVLLKRCYIHVRYRLL